MYNEKVIIDNTVSTRVELSSEDDVSYNTMAEIKDNRLASLDGEMN